ncbi:MAG: HAD-IIB family hydrolase, partial [Gammaproteobacteria bacterium]|nr:HAD-IIB family hydrolase [Gammaproteobacteria bacterium]
MIDKLLVCTDLDRTLLPNGPQSESPGSHRRFVSLVARPEVSLVYVTGRHRSLVEKAISQYRLPVPDYVVADVGTTIYHVGSGYDWQVQRDWRDEIAADWDGLGRKDIERMLQRNTALRLQEHAKQADFKLSYYVPVYEDRRKLAAELEDQLRKHNVMARLVWSIDELVGIGLLDILPARASKYHALVALMKQQGFDNSNTVFCGD